MLQASLWSLGLKSELVSSIETSGYKKKEGVAARAQVESDSVELPLLSCFFHFCFDPNHQISHSLSLSLSLLSFAKNPVSNVAVSPKC